MSSHARLAGSADPAFLDRFFSLEHYESVAILIGDYSVHPLRHVILEGVKNHPILVRVGASLLGGSYGVAVIAASIAILAEHTFKGLVNLFWAIGSMDRDLAGSAIGCIADGVGNGVYFSLKGIVVATVGTVGLVIAPQWTYKNIIAF